MMLRETMGQRNSLMREGGKARNDYSSKNDGNVELIYQKY